MLQGPGREVGVVVIGLLQMIRPTAQG
jgi:hypothetical protein